MQTQPSAALTMVGARAEPPEAAFKGHFQVAKPPGPPGNAPPEEPENERKPQGAEPIARPEEPDPLESSEAATQATTPDPLLAKAAAHAIESPSIPTPGFHNPAVATSAVEVLERSLPPTADVVPVATTPLPEAAAPPVTKPVAESTLSEDEVEWLGIGEVEVASADAAIPQDPHASGSQDTHVPGTGSRGDLLEKKGTREATGQSDLDVHVDAVSPGIAKGPVGRTDPDGLRQPSDSLKADLAPGSEPSADSTPFEGSQSGSGDAAGSADRYYPEEPSVKGTSEKQEHSSDLSAGVRTGKAMESTPTSRPVEGVARGVVDRASVVRQIADRLELLVASRPRDGVTIRLNPIELGTITLTVRQSGGEVETRVVASHEAVRAALETSRPQLQHALETRGLNLGSLDVGSGQPHHESSSQDLARDAARGRHPSAETARLGESVASNDWRESTRRATGVDLWI